MKASRLSFLLLGSALVLALPSFAGNTVKKSLEINDKVTVQGVQLLPGNYKIEWTEPGPKTEVSILRGRDLLAKLFQRTFRMSRVVMELRPGWMAIHHLRKSSSVVRSTNWNLALALLRIRPLQAVREIPTSVVLDS
jgi:hypothetical protein